MEPARATGRNRWQLCGERARQTWRLPSVNVTAVIVLTRVGSRRPGRARQVPDEALPCAYRSFGNVPAVYASPICRQELVLVGAAHELRTPLTVARGHLELLRRELNCPALEVALDELDRLGRIVARMLLIAELDTEPATCGRIELASLLAEAAAARPRVQIETAAPEAVVADKAMLLLALEELIANSLDRSPTDEPIVLACRESESGVIISVTDHGPGVDEEFADKVFDCFARVELDRGRSTGGAGLGLAIVRAVACAHHGRCGVYRREPGPSTSWWLWLPSAGDEA